LAARFQSLLARRRNLAARFGNLAARFLGSTVKAWSIACDSRLQRPE